MRSRSGFSVGISRDQCVSNLSVRGAVAEQLDVRARRLELSDEIRNAVRIRTGEDLPPGSRDLREPRELDQHDAGLVEEIRLAPDAAGVRQDLVRSSRQAEELDVTH